jgi:FtsZ-interacting cell division protein ZipA
MPGPVRTSAVKAALYLALSIVVIGIYVGIPLVLLIHHFVRSLLPIGAIAIAAVAGVGLWTIRTVRATAQTHTATRRSLMWISRRCRATRVDTRAHSAAAQAARRAEQARTASEPASTTVSANTRPASRGRQHAASVSRPRRGNERPSGPAERFVRAGERTTRTPGRLPRAERVRRRAELVPETTARRRDTDAMVW